VSKSEVSLKHGKEVEKALRRAGFYVWRRKPSESLFEHLSAYKVIDVHGREAVLRVDYGFDPQWRELCRVSASVAFEAVASRNIEGEVTPRAVLKAIKDLEKVASKALARIDKLAEVEPLKAEGFETFKRDDSVLFATDVLDKDKDCVGRISLVIGMKESSIDLRLTIPVREYRKVLKIAKEIARAVKRAGFQLRP